MPKILISICNCDLISSYDYYRTFSSIDYLYNFIGGYLCCNTNNCNNQVDACYTNEYVSNLISYNLTGSLKLNNITTQSNCSSSLSFSNVTLVIKMKINLVYLIDYNNLTSLASLSLIKNFEKFVDINISNIFLLINLHDLD